MAALLAIARGAYQWHAHGTSRSIEMLWAELKRRISGLVIVPHHSAHVGSMDTVPRSESSVGGQQMEDERLNSVVIARHLGISTAVVDRWAAAGRIPGAVAANGTWGIRMEDMVAMTIRSTEPDDLTSRGSE